MLNFHINLYFYSRSSPEALHLNVCKATYGGDTCNLASKGGCHRLLSLVDSNKHLVNSGLIQVHYVNVITSVPACPYVHDS